jgi:2-oxoglutarate ferredoxin oxidoreductase subunit alpha
MKSIQEKERVVVKFAGDSGDGMQLTGNQFSFNTALLGNDIATFPDFPAEIRAPIGTVAGVSGFQLQFGSNEVHTPGEEFDVLVAMNAAALKNNLQFLLPGGILILNTDGFSAKNLKLAGYEADPSQDPELDKQFQVFRIDVTKITLDALAEYDLSDKVKGRSKNMFVLGLLYWMFDRDIASTVSFIEKKFKRKPEIVNANIKALRTGFNYGETTEVFRTRYTVNRAKMPEGKYRSIMGNPGLAIGLVAASVKSELPLFYASYPITPASDILHELSRHKRFGVKTFQAEDEIAAVCAAIGAAYGGSLAVTATSGPGMALKTEGIGLATMLELPMVIVNVQRAGPSTGMPTKTEQADLMQALYGRNGECPLPVLAARSPSDCFDAAYEACQVALKYMTPVILLSDGYIANGAEPWRFPNAEDLPGFDLKMKETANGEFMPYARDEDLARAWAVPGKAGLEHRVGGLEKDDLTGNVSYDPDNHQKMVETRQAKTAKVAEMVSPAMLDQGEAKGKVLLLSWGSTYGVVRKLCSDLLQEGKSVGHLHLRWIHPLPSGLAKILGNFDKVLVPEINNGQLVRMIRDKFQVDAHSYCQIKGTPLSTRSLRKKTEELLDE